MIRAEREGAAVSTDPADVQLDEFLAVASPPPPDPDAPFVLRCLNDRSPTWRRNFVAGNRNGCGLGLLYWFDRLEGPDLPCGLPPHRVVTTWRPQRPFHGGFAGLTHGGLLLAVLDDCGARAATVRDGVYRLTAKLEARFRDVTPLESEVRCEAWLVDMRRSIAVVRAHALVQDRMAVEVDAMYAPLSARAKDLCVAAAGVVAG